MIEYPAVFRRHNNGAVSAHFPDFPGVAVEGKDVQEAEELAREMLECAVSAYRERGRALPRPSDPEEIEKADSVIMIAVE
jgi:predicted RNase H-like HicB family nuclease